jgi:hypothetical protein
MRPIPSAVRLITTVRAVGGTGWKAEVSGSPPPHERSQMTPNLTTIRNATRRRSRMIFTSGRSRCTVGPESSSVTARRVRSRTDISSVTPHRITL